jgi:hypothetical protein
MVLLNSYSPGTGDGDEDGAPAASAAGAAATADSAAIRSPVHDVITRLCRRLVTANFEDMDLDKQTDFDSEDVLAGRNRLRAVVLHNTLSSAIDLSLSTGVFRLISPKLSLIWYLSEREWLTRVPL